MALLAQTSNRLADPVLQGSLLIFVILFMALVGLLTIFLLLVVWRRYNARLSRARDEQSVLNDPWREAGQRAAVDEPDEDDDDDDATKEPPR